MGIGSEEGTVHFVNVSMDMIVCILYVAVWATAHNGVYEKYIIDLKQYFLASYFY